MKLKQKWKKISKKKKIVATTTSLVVVTSLIGSGIYMAKSRGKEMVKMTVQEVSASVGTILNSIVGTGTLAIDDSIEITIPSGVTVKEVKVESGDVVSKGDALATVDKASVLEAMNSVQEEMDSLDEKINDYECEEETTEVEAKVSGTVKKIYGKKGKSVTDCIAKNGALVVIALENGNTVDVTYNGGTIKSVSVEKGDEVSTGDTLMVIKDDEESAEYQQMIEERKALAKSYKQLAALSKKGTIEAGTDGTISEVNVSDNSSSSTDTDSSSGTEKSDVVFPSSSTGTVSATTLSTTTSVKAVTLADTMEETGSEETETLTLQIKSTGKTAKSTLVIPTPKAGETPISEIKAEDGSYTGKVVWTPADQTFQSGTTYSAKVILEAADGNGFTVESIAQIESGLVSGIQCSDSGKAINFQITYPATQEETKQETTPQKSEEKTTSGQAKESQTMPSGTQNAQSNQSATPQQSANAATGNNYSSVGTTVAGTVSNVSDTEDADSDSQSSYESSDEVVVFTMAGNDTMLITVSVDELDINSVEKGQEATVTLDAIEDQTFTGKVVKVGSSASSSGNGVAKYSVDVSIPKDEQMKVGMNASATIIVDSVENVVTLPVLALQEKGNKSFVYTEKDSEGNLTGEVEVTTGLSDGTTVEITVGLEDGDVVYYQRIGSSSGSSDGFKGGNFGGMNFDGEPPANFGGDGNMPQMMPGQAPGGSQ